MVLVLLTHKPVTVYYLLFTVSMFHLAKGKTKNSIHSVQRCFCVFVNDPQLATAQSGELLEQLQRPGLGREWTPDAG